VKYLDYIILNRNAKTVTIEITKQEYGGSDFGKKGYWPNIDLDGMVLGSLERPEWSPESRTLYLRGMDEKYDREHIKIPKQMFLKFKILAIEYNLYMMVKEKEEKQS